MKEDDMIVRQLELFIRNNGDMKELSCLLSISENDDEFLVLLRRSNLNN